MEIGRPEVAIAASLFLFTTPVADSERRVSAAFGRLGCRSIPAKARRADLGVRSRWTPLYQMRGHGMPRARYIDFYIDQVVVAGRLGLFDLRMHGEK